MATYKELKGIMVQKLSADPPAIGTGEIWYNTTTGALRAAVLAGTWASGPAFPANVKSTGQGCGTATAALSFGGNPQLTVSAVYNGSSWTTNPGLNVGRHSAAGFGISTAGVAVGGDQIPSTRQITSTESFNGSTWTEETASPYANSCAGGFGTNAAGAVVGGFTPPGFALTGTTIEYASGTWTAGGAISPSLDVWVV